VEPKGGYVAGVQGKASAVVFRPVGDNEGPPSSRASDTCLIAGPPVREARVPGFSLRRFRRSITETRSHLLADPCQCHPPSPVTRSSPAAAATAPSQHRASMRMGKALEEMQVAGSCRKDFLRTKRCVKVGTTRMTLPHTSMPSGTATVETRR
jgi:hypothetical protein